MNKLIILSSAALALLVTGHSQTSIAAENDSDEKGRYESNKRHNGNHRGKDDDRRNMKRAMHRLSHLDLSEQQKTDIKAAFMEGKQAIKAKREMIAPLKKEIKQLSNAEVLDEMAIREVSLQIANIKSDMMILHINKRREVEQLLTEEQRQKLAEMKEHRRKE